MAAGVVGAVAGWLFSTLTITVDRDQLAWSFGPGVFAKRVAVSSIEAFGRVSNPWHYGWGIHRTPEGWLYNVSGFSAVEFQLIDGTAFRLGTDKPSALIRAIKQAKRGGTLR